MLICDDPDAPTDEPWVHWVIYKIPADVNGLPEGIHRDARLKQPVGHVAGEELVAQGQRRLPRADAAAGPRRAPLLLQASTPWSVHLVVEPGLDKKTLWTDMKDHILGEGVLMGTYER